MKTAIILHGMPDKEEYFDPNSPAQSNQHWLPWIQRQLLLNGVLAQTPELPEPYKPVYEKWQEVFEQFPVGNDTILVGHSCGAGFLVRWLSENNFRVGKVALIAPFLDPDGDEVESNFFDFTIDKEMLGKTDGIKMFYSPDDDQEILSSVERLRHEIDGIDVAKFVEKGHFTHNDMGTIEFPELRDYLVGE